jgi:hypothetical protein
MLAITYTIITKIKVAKWSTPKKTNNNKKKTISVSQEKKANAMMLLSFSMNAVLETVRRIPKSSIL